MRFIDELRGEAAIMKLAEAKGVPQAEIVAGIQAVIDATWAGCDSVSRETRQKIFRGVKPSPAMFVGRLARYAK